MNEEQILATKQNTQNVRHADGKLNPSSDLMEYFRQYARERPEVVALWCVGIGFVLGWKLKPW